MNDDAASRRIVADTLPRYANLAACLAQDIAAGTPPVGSLLPTEAELRAQFGVSRATVREALRRLREIGLVAATHGVGTRVIASHPPPAYEMAVRNLADLMGYAQPTVLQIETRERCRVDAAMADLLGIAGGSDIVRLSGIRYAGTVSGPVLSVVEMIIPEAFAAIAERPEVGRVQLYRLIERERGIPVTGMEQEIAAIPLPDVAAVRLSVPPASPGIRIVRRFYGPGDRLLEATVNIHASAAQFSYRIRMSSPNPPS